MCIYLKTSKSEIVSFKGMCFDTFASTPTQKAIAYQNVWGDDLAVASLLLSSVQANQAMALLINFRKREGETGCWASVMIALRLYFGLEF